MDYSAAVARNGDVLLENALYFDLEQIFDCGQCFRWSKSGDLYRGVACGRTLEIGFEGSDLVLYDVSLREFEDIWLPYFDLGRDYGALRGRFGCDELLAEAASFSPGLRVLRQEPWETLCTFILSQNSNIPRIRRMVSLLCGLFGERLPDGSHAFPPPERLAFLTAADLIPVRCGYRDEYILDAARRVADGRLDLSSLFTLPVDEARKKLMEIHGVGPKVAECVLLYGFARSECFPLDVWMRRVMRVHYAGGFPEELGDVAGLAQQFLFHFARTGGLLDPGSGSG